MAQSSLFTGVLAAIVLLPLAATSGRCQEIDDLELSLPNQTDAQTRDWEGLKRDTRYFLGYQWVTIGILYLAPESVSGWSTEQKKGYDLTNWWDNVTNVDVDSDDFYINYLLHPYWGASYFVRAQERGYGAKGAFWYSVALSTMYEFGAEALFEEPSVQDLVVTPVLGSLLGMYFMRVRDNVRAREYELGYRTKKDKWIWVLTDPLGSLNQQFGKLFGKKTALQIRPYRYAARRNPVRPFELAVPENDVVYGLELRFEW